MIADDHDSEDDENAEANETLNKSALNETLTNIPRSNGGNAVTHVVGGAGDTDHDNQLINTGSEKDRHSLVGASPAF